MAKKSHFSYYRRALSFTQVILMPVRYLLAVFLLFPSLSYGEEAINYQRLGWADQETLNKLPVEQRPIPNKACHGVWLTPISAQEQATKFEDSPVEALAAWVYYNPEGNSRLNGDVKISQKGRLVLADNAELAQDKSTGQFSGNILLAEAGLVMTGEKARIDLASKQAFIEQSEFVSTFLNAHGRAKHIQRDENNVITIATGEYSTCEPNHRVWHFSAQDLRLDPNTGLGTIKNATLHIQNVPIVYLPYFKFPIDDRRISGLLVPRFGSTNDGGLDFAQPIYWNIAPNYDATLTPRLLSKRGLMAESEFRYLNRVSGEGSIKASFLPSDNLYDYQDRKSASWQHRYRPKNWQLSSNVNYVSDSSYFTDLGTDLTQSNTTHQERSAEFNYWGQTWSALMRVQSYQTIDKQLLDKDKPYARLPQLLITSQIANPWPNINSSVLSELTHFQRSIDDNSGMEVNGLRWRFEPEISYAAYRPWGFVKPSVGLRQLAYRLEDDTDTLTSINAATFNLDTQLIFERESSTFLQTLEPHILYSFSPYYQQAHLPNFDTATTTFSYAQLFRTRRFSGGDRLEDANQLAVGLTSRWLNPNTGEEQFRASIGEVFYFRDRKVQLNATDPIATASTSGVASELNVVLNQDWSSTADVLWTADGDISQFGLQVHYLPNTYTRLFNVGYSFRREVATLNQKALHQTNLSFLQPINDNWQMVGLWQYDLLNKESPESLLGVTYEACCWQMSLYRREFLNDIDNVTAADRKRSAFFIEFSLKGLAGLSSGARDLLKNRVFGYEQLGQKTAKSRF